MSFDSFPTDKPRRTSVGVGAIVSGSNVRARVPQVPAIVSDIRQPFPTPPVPVAAPGPYTQLAGSGIVGPLLQPGYTYLLSVAPWSGMTLGQLVANVNRKDVVNQSWDVGQVPANWPTSDSDPNKWRLSIIQGPVANSMMSQVTVFSTTAKRRIFPVFQGPPGPPTPTPTPTWTALPPVPAPSCYSNEPPPEVFPATTFGWFWSRGGACASAVAPGPTTGPIGQWPSGTPCPTDYYAQVIVSENPHQILAPDSYNVVKDHAGYNWGRAIYSSLGILLITCGGSSVAGSLWAYKLERQTIQRGGGGAAYTPPPPRHPIRFQ